MKKKSEKLEKIDEEFVKKDMIIKMSGLDIKEKKPYNWKS